MTDCTRIALGTVKLGVPDYGFSSSKQEADFDPNVFLEEVEKLGISKFDTSPRYGNAESVLGRYFQQSNSRPFVSTKIDNLNPNDPNVYKKMRESVEQSLRALHLENIDLCYLHQNELNIISDPYIAEGLQKLKQDGFIKASGASLYSLEECDHAISSGYFDYVQIPVNICDLSFYDQFVTQPNSNVKFVARSVFLQGTILNPDLASGKIKNAQPLLAFIQQLEIWAQSDNFSLLELALSFVTHLTNIDHYIIGTTNIHNLRSCIAASNVNLSPDLYRKLYDKAKAPEAWKNPRSWQLS